MNRTLSRLRRTAGNLVPEGRPGFSGFGAGNAHGAIISARFAEHKFVPSPERRDQGIDSG